MLSISKKTLLNIRIINRRVTMSKHLSKIPPNERNKITNISNTICFSHKKVLFCKLYENLNNSQSIL